MRYSVKYQNQDRNWVVADTANAQQIMGIHPTKAAAYRQAFAEQERWRKFDPTAKHLSRVRRMLPQTLVVG